MKNHQVMLKCDDRELAALRSLAEKTGQNLQGALRYALARTLDELRLRGGR